MQNAPFAYSRRAQNCAPMATRGGYVLWVGHCDFGMLSVLGGKIDSSRRQCGFVRRSWGDGITIYDSGASYGTEPPDWRIERGGCSARGADAPPKDRFIFCTMAPPLRCMRRRYLRPSSPSSQLAVPTLMRC
jgi:hypothetical protein